VLAMLLCWLCCAGDFVVLEISFLLVILLRRSTLCKLCGTQYYWEVVCANFV